MRGVAAQTSAICESELSAADESGDQRSVIHTGPLASLKNAMDRLREPGYYLQCTLENWSSFLILPLFAFFHMLILISSAAYDGRQLASVKLTILLASGFAAIVGMGVSWLARRKRAVGERLATDDP